MNQKVRWVARTGILLAMLIVLQALTKSFGQLVTGSCVNGVLALSVLLAGISSGAVVALLSPVLAFVLGIAPSVVTVPAIMVGNLVYVLCLWGLKKLPPVAALAVAAVAKFAALYLLVKGIICGIAATPLLSAGVLKEPMLKALPATFGWPQLVTALIGGGIALALCKPLKKAIATKN